MSNNKIPLYDAFGELLYVLTKADGKIQAEEIETLNRVLENHPWSREIKWSFNYEMKKHNNLEDLYKKVIYACEDIGPDPEYQFMLEVLEAVAAASDGIEPSEQRIIDRFKRDLIEKFSGE